VFPAAAAGVSKAQPQAPVRLLEEQLERVAVLGATRRVLADTRALHRTITTVEQLGSAPHWELVVEQAHAVVSHCAHLVSHTDVGLVARLVNSGLPLPVAWHTAVVATT